MSIADTVGYASPAAVRDLFEKARHIAGERFWCGHFHDTRGLALANVYAALETGVARFDATLAGIRPLTPNYASPEQWRGQPTTTAHGSGSPRALHFSQCAKMPARSSTDGFMPSRRGALICPR